MLSKIYMKAVFIVLVEKIGFEKREHGLTAVFLIC